jgi:Leucine-rich repeat (LRR) protein
MRTIMLFHALWVLVTIAGFGCDAPTLPVADSTITGRAVIHVQASALSAADIDRMVVTISGPGISPDIVVEIPEGPEDRWSIVISDIPAGTDRTFFAGAFNAAREPIYSGVAEGVTIPDGEIISVTINLQQIDPPIPFDNAAPVITAFVVSPMSVLPGEVAKLYVAAADANPEDTLTYLWSASGGKLSVVDSPITEWTAPINSGIYTVSVAVSDPQDATASLSAEITVEEVGDALIYININNSPEVDSLVPTPTRIDVGQGTTLNLTASDPEGDPLSFEWSADCDGSFDDSELEDPTFTLSTLTADECTLTVTIKDSHEGFNQASITIQTGPGVDPIEVPPGCVGPIEFPNTSLESAVRDAIGMPVADLYFDDVAGLTELTAWNADIDDLTGIECLVNLVSIDFINNNISDLSPLANLTQLTSIILFDNNVSDLTPLSGLTNLDDLVIIENSISDLSPLSGLTNLSSLYAEYNDFQDLSPLSGLINLTHIDFMGNDIIDISPLAGLVNLEMVNLMDNEITDLSPLVDNPGIGTGDSLDLGGNPWDCNDPKTLSDIAMLMSRGVDIHHICRKGTTQL